MSPRLIFHHGAAVLHREAKPNLKYTAPPTFNTKFPRIGSSIPDSREIPYHKACIGNPKAPKIYSVSAFCCTTHYKKSILPKAGRITLSFVLMFRCIPVMICLIGSLTFAESMQGRCVGVADGDTATVQVAANHQIKVRLEYIDAPERNQDFGKDAKQKLSDLILDKDVSLDISTTDKYGRSVAKVYVGGTDANLEMVKSGLAWHDIKYSSDAIDFSNAEKRRANRKSGCGASLPLRPLGIGEKEPLPITAQVL